LKEFVSIKEKILGDSGLSENERAQKLPEIRVQGASLEDLCLDFTLPGYGNIELIKDGEMVSVTVDNVEDYIEKVVDLTVGTGIRSQTEAFRKGFRRIFPMEDLRSFSVPELVILQGGSAEENWTEEGRFRSTSIK
jgi:E3 ubiquitin-protein ligase TRIP12